MILRFKLSFPVFNTWNNQFTGAGKDYSVKRNVKKDIATKILKKKNFSYNFKDGWVTNIEVEQSRKKVSNTFYCYEWMVDSIIKNNTIIIEKS